MSGHGEALKSLQLVSAALDAQQEAVDHFRATVSALASEIEALSASAAQYGNGLDHTHQSSVTLGETLGECLGEACRDFAASDAFDRYS